MGEGITGYRFGALAFLDSVPGVRILHYVAIELRTEVLW